MIIAIKENDVVYLAYDAYACMDHVSTERLAPDNSKVIKKHNDILIGTIAPVELNNAMRAVAWPKIENDRLGYDRLLFEGIQRFNNIRELVDDSVITFAYKSELYVFVDGVDLYEIDDFIVSGAGRGHGTAYLHLHKEGSAEERIIGAFRLTRDRITDAGNVIKIINTRDLEFVEVRL
jgi:hypothetical protein